MSRQNSNKLLTLAFYGLSRAHFHRKLNRDVCAELPEELKLKRGRDSVAELKRSWYELQDACRTRHQDYTDVMLESKFQKGKSNGTIFSHVNLDCRVLCHDDDLCLPRDAEAIKHFDEMLSKKYVYRRLAILGFRIG